MSSSRAGGRDPKEYIKSLKLGDHAVLFYDEVDRKDDIVSAAIQHFASKREKVLCMVPSRGEERTRDALVKHGIDVERFEKRGLLQILPTEFDPRSIAGFSFDCSEDAWKRWLTSYLNRAPARAILLIVDSPLDLFYSDDILRIEEGVGKRVPLPVTKLCVYHSPSAISISHAFYRRLIRLHRHTIFPGYATEIDPS